MKEVTYNDQYTLEDTLMYSKELLIGKLKFKYYHLLLFMVTTMGYIYSVHLTGDIQVMLLLVTIAMIVVILLIYVLYPKLVVRQVTKGYETNKVMQAELTITINDEGVRIKNVDINSLYKWENLYRANELDDGFALMVASNQFIIIKKRKVDANQLREKLLSVLGPKKCKGFCV